MGMSGQHHARSALYPRGNDPWYPLYRRLGVPQSRSLPLLEIGNFFILSEISGSYRSMKTAVFWDGPPCSAVGQRCLLTASNIFALVMEVVNTSELQTARGLFLPNNAVQHPRRQSSSLHLLHTALFHDSHF
jgi:hypothetical protein